MIAIIDYGMGNLRSVQKAFERIGHAAFITSEPESLKSASGVVLPGVGAFGKAMENLAAAGFVEAILEEIARGKPFLGICLGMQLLLDESEERFSEDEPFPKGLGVIRGRVRRFPEGLKVPQIGWNRLHQTCESRLFRGIEDGAYVYFVHSYYVDPEDSSVVSTTTDYGVTFASSLEKGRVMAVQFHPEKSSRVGLSILKNFGEVTLEWS